MNENNPVIEKEETQNEVLGNSILELLKGISLREARETIRYVSRTITQREIIELDKIEF